MPTDGTNNIKRWYTKLKSNLIIGFGGKCSSCGYNKCQGAMEFHHLNPTEKDFSISGYTIKNKLKIYEEVKKCAMLCANCHREVHAGLIKIEPITFNEELIPKKEIKIYNCEICQKETKNSRFCSVKCTGDYNRTTGLTNEVILELKKTKSFVEIGKMFNVTEAAVRKRYKKLTSTGLVTFL